MVKNINLVTSTKEKSIINFTRPSNDEAPFVYKSIEEILDYIVPTAEVTKIIKLVYNFKASEEQ